MTRGRFNRPLRGTCPRRTAATFWDRLVALKAGLAELADRPILPPSVAGGPGGRPGHSAGGIAGPENAETRTPELVRTTMARQMEFLLSAGGDLAGAHKALSSLAAAASKAEPMAEPEGEVAYWLRRRAPPE